MTRVVVDLVEGGAESAQAGRLLIGGRGSSGYERRDAIDLAERATGRTLTPGEVSSYWTNQTLAFIRSQPAAWLKLMARKVVLLWNSAEAFDTESQESYSEWSPLLYVYGHFLVDGAAPGVPMPEGLLERAQAQGRIAQ